ncbi:MAG: phosphatase PAP2 family protein, partial [Armatimonadota bacterium]
MRRYAILLMFFLTLILTTHVSRADDFSAPGNYVPAHEMLLDNEHFASSQMLFNEVYRYFFLSEPFKKERKIEKKDKKEGFQDKRNPVQIVQMVTDPKNILNFHDVTSQMNTSERILSAVATGYLFDKDYQVYTRADDYMRKNDFWKGNGSMLSAMGDAGIDLVLFGLISLKGDEKSKQVAQMGAEGLLDLNVQASKRVVGMARPSDTIANLGPSWVFDAFPSGHTYSVFTTATILGEAYKIKWLTYPLAFLSGLSRIQQNTHWPSDI